MKTLFSLNDDDGSLKMPLWLTEKQEHILKVKSKFIVNHKDLVERSVNVIDISFEYYHMGKVNVKGCYAKITRVFAMASPPGICDAEVSDEN